jgi:hypothetical protein
MKKDNPVKTVTTPVSVLFSGWRYCRSADADFIIGATLEVKGGANGVKDYA